MIGIKGQNTQVKKFSQQDPQTNKKPGNLQNQIINQGYPNQINLIKRFDELSLKNDDRHRQSLEDINNLEGSVLTESIDLRRDYHYKLIKNKTSKNAKKSKLITNSSTLTKESLQQFLTRAKQNIDQKSSNQYPQIKQHQIKQQNQTTCISQNTTQRSKDRSNIQRVQKSNIQKESFCVTKNKDILKNQFTLNEEYQIADRVSDKCQSSRKETQKINQLNSPYENNKLLKQSQLQSKSHKKANLNEQAMAHFLRKRNESINLVQNSQRRILSKERQFKAHSLIRVDENQLTSFLGENLSKSNKQTILQPSQRRINQSSTIQQSMEKPKVPLNCRNDQTHQSTIKNMTMDQLSPKVKFNQQNFFESLVKKNRMQIMQSPQTQALIQNISQLKQSQSPIMSRNLKMLNLFFNHTRSLRINSQTAQQRQTLDVNSFSNHQQQKLIHSNKGQNLKNHTSSTQSILLSQDSQRLLNYKQSPLAQIYINFNQNIVANMTRNNLNQEFQQLLTEPKSHSKFHNNLSGQLDQLIANKTKVLRKNTIDKENNYGFQKVTEEEEQNLQTEQSKNSYEIRVAKDQQQLVNQKQNQLRLLNKSKMLQNQQQSEKSIAQNKDQLQLCLSACKSPAGFKKQMHYILLQYNINFNQIIIKFQ